MKGPSRIEQFIEVVETELDAGRPVPTRPWIAERLGLPRSHDFGGRATFALQKLEVERGIATPGDIRSYEDKRDHGTYGGPVAPHLLQRQIVAELKERGEFFRHSTGDRPSDFGR